ncbi:hypothetical protein IQ10_00458 [Halalkalibacter nanhaiisediminis]|uniref:Uncharacterized protein n=1 Tax=Halalkalibacter nanhaiisediminis TaxID=688079 RepID=A0A562QUQ1_9BACI|nr:hypothetical protein IQ10_00458 [Halalkalibacter nanhaiisediminis]
MIMDLPKIITYTMIAYISISIIFVLLSKDEQFIKLVKFVLSLCASWLLSFIIVWVFFNLLIENQISEFVFDISVYFIPYLAFICFQYYIYYP